MFKLGKISIIIFLGLIGCCFAFTKADAAVVSVTPLFRSMTDQEQLIVDVRLNSEGKVINAVQASVIFPANMLEVKEISHGGSFLTLWPQEPVVDKSTGTISFAGGVPHGSLVMDGRLIRITFAVKSVGNFEISFDQQKTSVHLNDGLGTAIPLRLDSGLYKINPAVFITINSSTHPDEDVWYRNSSPIFQWQTKAGAIYSYVLSDDPDKIPDDVSDQTNGTVGYTNLHDGIYYFILKERESKTNWSLIGKRRVMIDTTAPSSIQGIVERESSVYANQYFLSFAASDVTSGIDHYEITEEGKTRSQITSPYVLRDQTRRSAIIVRAVDRAGNNTEAVFGDTTALGNKLDKKVYVAAGLIIVALLLILGMVWPKLKKKR